MARKKNLITLAKELDFNSGYEYFRYCIDSFINGQKDQCRSLFNDMSKDDQKNLVAHCRSIGLPLVERFYFELL